MRAFRDGSMRVPVGVWDDGVQMEHEVLNQMRSIASLPIVTGAALMADGHAGIGGPVGGVVVTRAAIIPAVTSVDLGCGMVAVKTDLLADDLDGKLPALRATIEDQIPSGDGRAPRHAPGSRSLPPLSGVF
jgi:tRNA-splicing ligase RtcB (3'-phosphate/5'-hydroxy nucleic acid ligase)